MNQYAEIKNSNSAQERPKKFMVFKLGDDRFAIPLSDVKEVIGLTVFTPIPDMPKFFKGLINLRGKIISTIDLKLKLSIPVKITDGKKACIIITEMNNALLGAVVDNVSEVVSIPNSNIERQLDISCQVSRDYISGVAKFENQPLTVLLNLSKVLNLDELSALHQYASSKQAA